MDAKNDLICIGAKDQKGCFIYSKSGASVTKQQELDINDPITAIKFRFVHESICNKIKLSAKIYLQFLVPMAKN